MSGAVARFRNSLAWAGGQASLELVGGAAALLLTGLVAAQLLGAGYAAVMADHAAEAGALAIANGRPAAPAARDAVPGWPGHALEVRHHDGRVDVRLLPPSPLRFLRDRLSVRGSAELHPVSWGPDAGASP